MDGKIEVLKNSGIKRSNILIFVCAIGNMEYKPNLGIKHCPGRRQGENVTLELISFRPIYAKFPFCPLTVKYAHPAVTFILAKLAQRRKMRYKLIG